MTTVATSIKDAYLDAARSAVRLLSDPAVDAAWGEPSALPEFSVGGLAAHLAHQVLAVPATLDAPAADAPIPLLDHYERATWRGADPLAEVNVGIRTHADQLATEGAASLAARLGEAIEQLATRLPSEPDDRPVRMAAGPWTLRLDDYLVTRMMEIAVHSDDLAVSVGLETPDLPAAALEPVLALLTGLAVRRHGQPAVLRALARAERAPEAINAL
jgi:mycothiol maleylpyruvate isomerase-like protein